jgi:uncharacterized protein (TIRG00374 family)
MRVIGLVVLGLVIRQADFGQVADTLKSLRFWPLFGALLLSIPFFAVKSWRWRLILRKLGINIPNRDAIQLYGAGLFVGQATPGQLGEMVRAHFLWKRGHDPVKAAGSVVVDRILDMIVLALFALGGIAFFTHPWVLVVLVLATVAAVTLFFFPWGGAWISALTAKLTGRGRLHPLAQGIQKLLIAVQMSMADPKAAGFMVVATLTALALNFIRFYLLLAALGLTLPIASFIFGISLANFIGLLPVTIFGIGLREAVLIQVFQSAGQTTEAAIAFSALILLVAYLLNLLWGFVAWVLETK